jgi:glycosyltransferase involved in cell wall biosynthesis
VRITYWWRQPTGYFDACTRALTAAGHEVRVIYESPLKLLPFESLSERGYGHLASVHFWDGVLEPEALAASIDPAPDVLVVASWSIPQYLKGSVAAPPGTLRLVASDSPWRASAKQVGAQFTHRRRLAEAYDGAWVTGWPARLLVQRLGFAPWQVIEHMYCCDTALYTPGRSAAARLDSPFLFVGRLMEHKGLIPLRDGFQRFRSSGGSSRSLRVIGSGPVDLQGEGVEVIPFVEPDQLHTLMDDSYALVHPAFLEHWGVVVHEASSMGLPLILTPDVGGATRFLSHGLSGLYVDPDEHSVADALFALDQLGPVAYEEMSAASKRLGSMLTLESWVQNLERGVALLRRRLGK